jgi:ribosomal-protein-alanine N-acetyltransferase
MAAADDAALLAGIHAECFEDHWSEVSFRSLLESAGVFGLLACHSTGRQVASFILMRVAADEAEVLTLATLPARRREGLASAVASAAMDQAKKGGALRLFLEVAETNLPGLQLYKKLGFEAVALRARYYESKTKAGVGAVVMRRELSN